MTPPARQRRAGPEPWRTSRTVGRRRPAAPQQRTDRYGSGKRWRARHVDADGRERSQTFARKGDAERFLVAVEADLLRGTYVDPQRAKLTLAAYAERWLQPLRLSSRRTYEIYLRMRASCPPWARGRCTHLDPLSRRHVASAAPDPCESVERGVVRVGQGVQVALGGGDAGVPEPLFDDLQVGAASEQPRGVRVT